MGILGRSLGVPGRLWGCPRGVPGGPWALSEALKNVGFYCVLSIWGFLGIPESVWGVLGHSLGVREGSLGSLWGSLGGLGGLLGIPGKLLGIPGGSSGAPGRSTWGSLGASWGVFGGPQGENLAISMEIEHFHVPKMSLQGGSWNTKWVFLLIRIAKIEALQ